VPGGRAGGVLGGIFANESQAFRAQISMGISGTVLDRSGAVVPGSTITVVDASSGAAIGHATADAAGRFAVPTGPGTWGWLAESKSHVFLFLRASAVFSYFCNRHAKYKKTKYRQNFFAACQSKKPRIAAGLFFRVRTT
jgi:hypothetical protein